MITGYALALVLCAMMLCLLFILLRTRRIREKYAGVWMVVSLGVVVLAIFPKLAFWLSGVAHVSTPVNLLFAVSIAVLLVVCIQLSTEVSTLEEETRTVAEELALLRMEVRAIREGLEPTAPTTTEPAYAPAPDIPAFRTSPQPAEQPSAPAGPYQY